MPLSYPFDAPDLATTFGARKSVMKALNKAGVKSVTPVMMLPQEVLRSEFDGIGASSARFITSALAEHGLPHRTISQKRHDFVNEHFGCIEDAPIGVLQVGTVLVLGPKGKSTRASFSPLEVVSLMEDIQPKTTVIDLLLMGKKGLKQEIAQHAFFGLPDKRLARDIEYLQYRLKDEWQLQFSTSEPELRLVNE